MAEEGLPIAIDEIDVFIAVNVIDARTARAVADHRIDEILPFLAEPGGGARIGKNRPIVCRQAL